MKDTQITIQPDGTITDLEGNRFEDQERVNKIIEEGEHWGHTLSPNILVANFPAYESVKEWRNKMNGHYEDGNWVVDDSWKPIPSRPRNPDGIEFRTILRFVAEKNEQNRKPSHNPLLLLS